MEDGGWICPICTLLNDPLLTHCTACDTPQADRELGEAEYIARMSGVPVGALVDPEEFKAGEHVPGAIADPAVGVDVSNPVENAVERWRQEGDTDALVPGLDPVADAMRELELATEGDAPELPGTPWTCPICTLNNGPIAMLCGACGGPRPPPVEDAPEGEGGGEGEAAASAGAGGSAAAEVETPVPPPDEDDEAGGGLA